ncbi:MAG TPA: hypothetical protein VIL42_10505 [Sphingomicrobium sp.]|jgi:hypothetical protein
MNARVTFKGRNQWVHDGRDGRHSRHNAIWHRPRRSLMDRLGGFVIVALALLAAWLSASKGWHW